MQRVGTHMGTDTESLRQLLNGLCCDAEDRSGMKALLLVSDTGGQKQIVFLWIAAVTSVIMRRLTDR